MAVEEFLGQIRKAGVWQDYARGHKASSIAWAMGDRANRRVVDWIDKDRIIWPEPTPPRQDADGTPYLTYFTHEPMMASFAWSGDMDQPIEVAYAEAGEPVDARFPFEVALHERGDMPLWRALREFRRQCDDHLARKSKEDT